MSSLRKEIKSAIEELKGTGEVEKVALKHKKGKETTQHLTIGPNKAAFSLSVTATYDPKTPQENVLVATDAEELDEWLVTMICGEHKTLSDAVKAAVHAYTGDDGFDDDGFEDDGFDDDGFDGVDVGDFDDQEFLGDDDMFGQPGSGIEVRAGERKSIPDDQRVKAEQFFTGDGSMAATQRLVKDLQDISLQDTSKFGFEVDVVDDNLYLWSARLFDFEGDLAKDMKKKNVDAVELEIRFPSDYPFSPPFIRVVKPRFKFHTGHVTIGGSICAEYLTRSGWRPSNDIEGTIIQIRTELMVGGGRLDANQNPYSLSEAQSAFTRVARQHGWN